MLFGGHRRSQRLIELATKTALTHWGRVTHICVSKLTIIGSDNGLSPGRRQAIIWTNAGILLIGPMGINLNEILIEFNTFSFNKMHLKMMSAKWCLFCLGLNVLRRPLRTHHIQPMVHGHLEIFRAMSWCCMHKARSLGNCHMIGWQQRQLLIGQRVAVEWTTQLTAWKIQDQFIGTCICWSKMVMMIDKHNFENVLSLENNVYDKWHHQLCLLPWIMGF